MPKKYNKPLYQPGKSDNDSSGYQEYIADKYDKKILQYRVYDKSPFEESQEERINLITKFLLKNDLQGLLAELDLNPII